MDNFINLIIVFGTAAAFASRFRNTEGIWNARSGLFSLRFFTTLSNLLCAAASLAVVLAQRQGRLPFGIWLWKYIGTSAVTVTLLTVIVFLGPTAGYKILLKGWGLFLHLIGPLLAVFSFCFLERSFPLPFGASLLGLLPVLLYGAYYLHKVVLCPETNRWEDFYGFNKNGKWLVSFACMLAGTFLVCALLWLLCRI